MATNKLEIKQLLLRAFEEKASDLHITVGIPPMYRIDGKLQPYGDTIVTPQMVKEMVDEIIPDFKRQEYEGSLSNSVGEKICDIICKM